MKDIIIDEDGLKICPYCKEEVELHSADDEYWNYCAACQIAFD